MDRFLCAFSVRQTGTWHMFGNYNEIKYCLFPSINLLKKNVMNSVQSLSCVQLFETPWTIACQTSLSITSSQSLLKLISIESVMPSNHLILCHPLFLSPSIVPSISVFTMSLFLPSGGQSIGVSASTLALSMNIQGSFPLGWTCWISLQSKGLSFKSLLQHHSSKASILLALSFLCRSTLTSIQRRQRQPTPVFLPGKSQGQQRLLGCHLWGHTESNMTEVI